jgi:hypothetical protein
MRRAFTSSGFDQELSAGVRSGAIAKPINNAAEDSVV